MGYDMFQFTFAISRINFFSIVKFARKLPS